MLAQQFKRVQRALIEPAQAITEPAERRRVRVLSGLTLFITGALWSGAFASGVLSLYFGALMALFGYGLSRTAYYRWGVVGAIVAFELPSVTVVYSAPELLERDFWASIVWFAIPLLLTSFWLKPAYTAGITVVNVLLIAMTAAFQANVSDITIIIASGFVATLGGVAVLGSYLQAQNQQELEAAKAEAEEANKIKSDFLSTMSHELRTPLSAIIGFSEMLMMGIKGDLNPDQQKYAELIHRNSTKLLTLINDVLDISKMEAQRVIVRPDLVTLESFFHDLLEGMMPLADEGVTLGVAIDDDVPPQVMVDPAHLERVVTNLVGNALKFTHEGSVQIIVEQPMADQWAFSVVDTGIGIDKKAQSTIFEPFRQADTSPTRQYGGTGLGLAIVKSLVEEMGGTITLSSILDEGTTFRVVLPVTVKSVG